MIQRLMDWIDEVGHSLVRPTLLAAGFTAVAFYFGGGNLGQLATELARGNIEPLVPWAVAFAVETFMYLMARRTSKAWGNMQSPVLEADVKRGARNDFWASFAVLLGLMVFSGWNQLNFLAETWQPAQTALIPVAPWLQLAIRAFSVPIIFMFTAFMAPQPETIKEMLNNEAHKTLRGFLKLLRKQTKQQQRALKNRPEINLGNAIIRVSEAANEKKAGMSLAAVQEAMALVAAGKTPTEATDLAFGEPSAPTTKLGSVEDRVRRAYRRGMTPKTLAQKAGVSMSTAKRWVKKFEQKDQRGLKLVA